MIISAVGEGQNSVSQKMKLGRSLAQLVVFGLLTAALVPYVFASSGSVTAISSPSNLAPDGINTLTISGNALIGSVIVQGPDGTNYTSTAKCTSSNPCLAIPNPVVLNFGTSVSGWHVTRVGTGCLGYTPVKGGPASTHCGGDYEYTIVGINGTSIHNITTTSETETIASTEIGNSGTVNPVLTLKIVIL